MVEMHASGPYMQLNEEHYVMTDFMTWANDQNKQFVQSFCLAVVFDIEL